jgi:hypothetical protein
MNFFEAKLSGRVKAQLFRKTRAPSGGQPVMDNRHCQRPFAFPGGHSKKVPSTIGFTLMPANCAIRQASHDGRSSCRLGEVRERALTFFVSVFGLVAPA